MAATAGCDGCSARDLVVCGLADVGMVRVVRGCCGRTHPVCGACRCAGRAACEVDSSVAKQEELEIGEREVGVSRPAWCRMIGGGQTSRSCAGRIRTRPGRVDPHVDHDRTAYADPLARRRSTSACSCSAVSPRIRNCLFRFVPPLASSTCERFNPSHSRSNSVMASLARPSSGGAVTATFNAPACSPFTPDLRAPGWARTAKQAAVGEGVNRDHDASHFFFAGSTRTNVTAVDLPATISTMASLLPRTALYRPASTPFTVIVF